MTRQAVFQKIICFWVMITFVVSMFVFCPVHAPAEALPANTPAEEEPADLALARLNRYAEMVMTQKELAFGYPGNPDIHLTGFYEWLLESGVSNGKHKLPCGAAWRPCCAAGMLHRKHAGRTFALSADV